MVLASTVVANNKHLQDYTWKLVKNYGFYGVTVVDLDIFDDHRNYGGFHVYAFTPAFTVRFRIMFTVWRKTKRKCKPAKTTKIYGNTKEVLPKDAPKPLGKHIMLSHYVDPCRTSQLESRLQRFSILLTKLH
jgi:hypothetical protein